MQPIRTTIGPPKMFHASLAHIKQEYLEKLIQRKIHVQQNYDGHLR